MNKRSIILLLLILIVGLSACKNNTTIGLESKTPAEIHDRGDPITKEDNEDSPLKYLLEKTGTNITISDIKLLLETPTTEINEYFNIAQEDINNWMMGNTADAPMKGITFSYGYGDTENLPEYLVCIYLWYSDEKGEELPLGYTIDEVLNMPQWGKTPIKEFRHAGGYTGPDATPIKMIRYNKSGLSFSFEMGYNNVFFPEEEQDTTIDLIVVSLDSENSAPESDADYIEEYAVLRQTVPYLPPDMTILRNPGNMDCFFLFFIQREGTG